MMMTLHSGFCNSSSNSPSQEEHCPLLLTRKKTRHAVCERQQPPVTVVMMTGAQGGRHVASRVTESAYGEIRVVDDWVKRTLSPRRAY